MPQVPPRIHVLLAREAAIGLVLRRGPSRWVELVLWDRETDRFTRGAWFNGRIYERRCDLSPKGDLLVYFAMSYRHRDPEYAWAWTAVSKPPWLAALALWPKPDTWGGGGLFTGHRDLWVNHDPLSAEPHQAHRPEGLSVTVGEGGHGEDLPIYEARLKRDGWRELAPLSTEYRHSPPGFVTIEPGRWERPHPSERWRLAMTTTTVAYANRYEYELVGAESAQPLVGAEWADWDGDRGLVYAASGRLFRARPGRSGFGVSTELIDLSGHRPTRRASPAWARKW